MTTRQWMVAVAILAVFIAGVRAATRPIPEGEAIEVGTGRTFWSDGVVTSGDVAHLEVPRPVENKYILFCRVVRWSDGSVSFRLRLP
jgi:hypothetical protein